MSPDRRIQRLGIDTSTPGFYDDPVFMQAEQRDPTMLEAYADFVSEMRLPETYLAEARDRVQKTTAFLHEKLVADGRKGACVDASMVLSRFLERQQVWNYIATGALTLEFPPNSGIKRKHFSPIMLRGNPAVAGHVWVVAPPFKVVDLTVSMQPYEYGEEKYLSGVLLAETGESIEIEAISLYDTDVIDDFVARRGAPPTLRDVRAYDPMLLNRIARYGPVGVTVGEVRLKYVPCAISAPDSPLEDARNLCLSGKYPGDLWREFEAGHGC